MFFTQLDHVLQAWHGCIFFYRVLPSFFLLSWTKFYKHDMVLPSFTGFYLVLLGFSSFFLRFFSNQSDNVLQEWLFDFTSFYRVLPSFTGFYLVLLGFYHFSNMVVVETLGPCFTTTTCYFRFFFYRVLPIFTGFYLVLLGFTELTWLSSFSIDSDWLRGPSASRPKEPFET